MTLVSEARGERRCESIFGMDLLTAYIDDIEMGGGEGKNGGLPEALDQKDKLASYWTSIKAGD